MILDLNAALSTAKPPAGRLPLDILWAELHRVLEHEKPAGYLDHRGRGWSYHLPTRNDFGFARAGRAGSPNHTRLAMAIFCAVAPAEAADLWLHLLAMERSAHTWLGTDGWRRVFGHHGFEPLSRNYWDFNVVAAAAAARLLEGSSHSAAIAALVDEVRASVGLLSLAMIPRYQVRRRWWRLEWRGPHSVAAGVRAPVSSHLNPGQNEIFARATRWPHFQRKTFPWSDFVHRLRLEGFLTLGDVVAVRDWIERADLRALDHIRWEMCRDVRTLAPIQFRRYRDSVHVLLGHMIGGLTGSTFYGTGPTDRQAKPSDVDLVHPYPAPRVRGGPTLGRGYGTVLRTFDDAEDVAVEVSNLTAREADQRGVRYQVIRRRGLPPGDELVAVLKADRSGLTLERTPDRPIRRRRPTVLDRR